MLTEILEFESESLSLHLIIAVQIEGVLDWRTCSLTYSSVVNLIKYAQLEHLACKVAAVELDLEDRFLKVLELRHGEHLREKLESYRLEMDLLTESLESYAKDSVMVERQRRN